jgi:hypothetical protein
MDEARRPAQRLADQIAEELDIAQELSLPRRRQDQHECADEGEPEWWSYTTSPFGDDVSDLPVVETRRPR